MITLNTTLQTAQDSLTRNPTVELISSSYLADIPFDGVYFNYLSTPEIKPNLIYMSSGRIAGTFLRGGDIYLVTTNVERNTWTETLVKNESGAITSACPVEMASGIIGIVYLTGTYVIKSITVNPDNLSSITAAATLITYTSSYWVGDVHVSRQSDTNYRMVYSYRSSAGAYGVMMAVSADFTTWATPALISISGLSTSYRFGNPSLQESDASTELFLLFDYVNSIAPDSSELINIYYQISADMGSTWAAPVKKTAYTQYGKSGYHPAMAQRSSGDMELAWTEKNNVLSVDSGSDGFEGDCLYYSGYLFGTDFHYDPSTDKLYIKNIYTGTGDKYLCSVIVVDVPTWEIDKCYTTASVPAYNAIFKNSHVWWHRWRGTGPYICCGTYRGSTAMVIDPVADTVTTYKFFSDNTTYGLVKNVDTNFIGSSILGFSTGSMAAAWLDGDTQRLYLMFQDGYLYTQRFYLGYLDITETADPITGKYTWHEIMTTNIVSQETMSGFNSMTVVPDAGFIMVAYNTDYSSWRGRLLVISIETGAILYDFNDATAGYHDSGSLYPVYYDGSIYCSFSYRSDYTHVDYRGLMQIHLASGAITYHRPTFATADDYGLGLKVATGDGKLVIGTAGYGVVIFDCNSHAWTLYNNTTLPGLTPDGSNALYSVDYDPVTQTIFAGANFAYSGWTGVSAFSLYGAFYQGKYQTGEYTTSWAWDTTKDLTLNRFDMENALAVDDESGMWSIWVRRDSGVDSVKWDNESGELNLSEFIPNGNPVSISWSLDSPNRLTFSLAQGHLFDPHNQLSLYATAVALGMLITCRMGEVVSGVTYWQNQGQFVVTNTKITYTRGSYPIITVTCEDMTNLWDQGQIIATEDFDNTDPATVLDELVSDYALLTSSQIAIPTIANTHNIYHQFVDVSLADAIKTILDHFGYFTYINPNNQFAPKRINLAASTNHTYSNADTLLNYSPDNAYSNFINRVTVTGESHDYLEVLYDEESVGALSGVIGWWGEHQVKRVYYSEDQERKVRNPRLEITQSVTDFWLFEYMGGGSEAITATDVYEKWVEITIEGPDLTAVVIAEIAAVLVTGTMAISCEFNCGIYIFSMCVTISVLFYTLACFAAYSYTIWGRPIGSEKQTIQATANDTDLQQLLNGQIIETTLDDPLCYTVAHCQRVADYELSIVQAQRRRVQFDKIAHLQDEVGDILSIVHPYSLMSKRVFVTDLTRSIVKPTDTVSNDGGVTDKISGWFLT